MEKKNQRDDGRATQEKLLVCAGRIIAEKGYAATTSKEICEMAGMNTAAINYHFGSREGMYKELLKLVHREFLNRDELKLLATAQQTPREKLEAFLERFAAQVMNDQSWPVEVWAREIMNPSPWLNEILSDVAVPKGLIMAKVVSDYTGIPLSSPQLYSCILSFIAPFTMIFLGRHNRINYRQLVPQAYPEEELLPNLKRFAFAGLDAFCEKEAGQPVQGA